MRRRCFRANEKPRLKRLGRDWWQASVRDHLGNGFHCYYSETPKAAYDGLMSHTEPFIASRSFYA